MEDRNEMMYSLLLESVELILRILLTVATLEDYHRKQNREVTTLALI